MKIIVPTTITNTELDSSTVAENDYSEWDISTSYLEDDFVIVIGTTHKIYKSVAGSNLGNDPTTDDGTWWTEISATNRWKAFDQKIGVQVEDTTQIEYVFSGLGLVDGVALFGLDATQCRLIIENGSPLTEVYNELIDLNDNSVVVDGYTYFFEPLAKKAVNVFQDIPPYTEATYTVQVGDSGETCKVGQIVLGRSYVIGDTLFGARIGIEDFSTKERNAFGEPVLTVGNFADTVDYPVRVNTQAVGRYKTLLSSFRATPIVWTAGDDTDQYGTTVYGYYEDWYTILTNQQSTQVNIEVQGLT